MARKLCITAVDGQTGFLIAELILKHRGFSRKIDSLVGLSLHPQSDRAKELRSLGATIVHHVPGRELFMVKTLKDTGCDTLCLVPPTHEEKYEISVELVHATKKANIQNVLLISSVGCDYTNAKNQPRLREFIDIEKLALEAK
ncbi:uncharacterized protein ColSpa_10318 [Colletotrichum spaethianum]|uniref:NmrA-like domain-containing protein n=1 Tax=Colletotrichum spaethianum TaxID=700344 RepID=A0AA37PDC5_9PEZI|nr:uncharacterized protein ColSpa_10318 [Colletotrichum spaethianum]GKT50137.1 hypothetical protein ColSpa_10318 [Colletotrichum spaethianum]